jgi:hypothetical protein
VPKTAQYLLDRGVELMHHAEDKLVLELDTQHFVRPKGGGLAMFV